MEKADAVLVGGGVMGCALAYQLARRGLSVALCERAELGSQSTARCAGGVRQQFSAETNVRIQRLSVRMLTELEDEIGTSAGFRQIGYLFALTDPAQAEDFRRLLRMWHRLGLKEARWVEPAEIERLVPILNVADVQGGTFCPTDGIASPADVTSGYAGAARRLGAVLHEGRAVTGIRLVGGRVAGVTTQVGAISAPLVFVCAGAWSPAIGRMAGVDIPIRPFRRQAFVTGPLPGISRELPMVVDMATSFYFHPEGEGLLLGMSDRDDRSTFDTEVRWDFLERIVEVATARAPALQAAEIRTGWAGLYEVTPDDQAILGPVADVPGLWCACGFSGHGFMQAPAAALLLAQLLVDGRPEVDLTPLGHDRFARGELVPERNVI